MRKFITYLFIFSFFSLFGQNPYFEIAKQMEIYNDALKKLSTNYIDEINFGDLMQKNTKRMLNSLDRFTTFYDEQGILNQRMRQQGHFGGLGISIKDRDSILFIMEVYKNTPAQKEGLKPGDEIRAINGKPIKEMEKGLASNLLRGPKGSKVMLEIGRNGKILKKEISRDDIALDAVTSTYLDGDIGYIRFVKFNQKASSQVKKAILDLKEKGARKIIIDVRGNPGGLLNEVVKIVNFFIPKGKTVVTTKGRFKKYTKTYATRNESLDEEIPLVILVNNRSASASEILSGALQDYDRAVIIGDTTYGKGLVQRTYKLKYGTYMKQTISKYYIPSGRLIQKIDYWHRDKNGNPTLLKDHEQTKEYHTVNGRKVFNLGGVIPDVVVEDEVDNSLIRDLVRKNYLFDFVTYYYYKHPVPQSFSDFKLPDDIIDQLIKYLKTNDKNAMTRGESLLKKAYQNAQKEKQTEEILAQYKEMLKAYNKADDNMIRENKDYLTYLIGLDLSRRYFFEDGQTNYKVQNDKVIHKAKEILNNREKYNSLLGK
jgi:carboxyl-terminal processing protease